MVCSAAKCSALSCTPRLLLKKVSGASQVAAAHLAEVVTEVDEGGKGEYQAEQGRIRVEIGIAGRCEITGRVKLLVPPESYATCLGLPGLFPLGPLKLVPAKELAQI